MLIVCNDQVLLSDLLDPLTCSVSMLVTSCGMAYSWVSPVLTELTDPNGEIRATDQQVSWIAVFIEVGTLTTPFFTSYLMDNYGRKWPALCCVPAFILSWVLTLTTRSVTILYIKRVIDGMIIGIEATISPIYLAEISTASSRGAMVISIVVSWNFGSFLQFCIGTFLSYSTCAWINMVLPIIFFIAFYLLPESPYYLMMKHREAEAATSLAWFRDTHPNLVSEELTSIKEFLKKDKENKESLTDAMKNRTYRKCFLIMIVMMLATTMTGINSIFSYASEMFADTGSGGFLNADTCSLTVVFLFFTISIIISCIIDKCGRRPLALISGFGSFVSQLGSAYYFYFEDDINYNWIPLVTIGSYCFFISVGLFPITTAYQGELFPPSIKSAASGLCVVLNTCIAIFAVKLYYIINTNVGMHFNYLVYAIVAAFSTVWLYFNAPETKNKTFNELYDELNEIPQQTVFTDELKILKITT